MRKPNCEEELKVAMALLFLIISVCMLMIAGIINTIIIIIGMQFFPICAVMYVVFGISSLFSGICLMNSLDESNGAAFLLENEEK